MSSPERKWALSKVGPGDWVCWSNDRSRLWRFHSYVDGAVHGLVDCGYEERTFWRAVYVPAEMVTAALIERDRWDRPWIEDAWRLPTRRAAIERMLAP